MCENVALLSDKWHFDATGVALALFDMWRVPSQSHSQGRPMSTFMSNAPKWQCCCCHLTTSCKIIAILEICICIIGFGLCTASAAIKLPWMLQSIYIITAIICLVSGFSALLLLVGIQRRRIKLLYPYTIVHGIVILVVCVLIVVSFLVPVEGEKQNTRSTARLVFSLGGALAFAMIIVFCIYTVTRVIQFLRNVDRKMQKRFSRRVKRGNQSAENVPLENNQSHNIEIG